MTIRRRVFTPAQRDEIIRALRECRAVCTRAMRDMPIAGAEGSPYRATQVFVTSLHEYVEALTGDRKALLDRRQSDPPKAT